MAFKKKLIVMSGSGKTGLVKLAGSFDGLGKVKGECACEVSPGGGKLYIIADEVTEIAVESSKQTFEVPVAAKDDIYCLFVSGGCTMTGSTGGRADRRELARRVELAKREKLRAAAEAKRSVVTVSDPAAGDIPAHISAPSSGTPPLPCDTPSGTAPDRVPPGSRAEDAAETLSRADAFAAERPSELSEAPFSPLGSRAAAEGRGVRFDGTNFYRAVKPQIDELFVRYPAEERLNALVPNSKWVRVDVDADDYYVLGVLFDLSSPIFICYGVPGTRTVPPPRDIAPAAVWLPLDNNRPDSDGFWMIYQSATDGKCIT